MEEYLNYTSLEQFRETDSINNSTGTSDQNNSSNGTEDAGLIDETARMVAVVSLPIIILFGTIGNFLTFVAMRRHSLKLSSTCFYICKSLSKIHVSSIACLSIMAHSKGLLQNYVYL